MNSFDQLGTVSFSKQTLPGVFPLILSAVKVCRAVGYSCCGREGVMQLSRTAGGE